MDPEAKSLVDLAKNLEPELVPDLESVFESKGECPVARSPNFTFIMCCALKGMQHRAIASALQDERQERIPWIVIRDYILKFVPAKLMKPGMYVAFMSKRFAHMDETAMVENITRMQYSRLADMLESGRVRSDELRREIDLFGKLVKQSADVKVALGKVVTAPGVNATPPVPNTHITNNIRLNSRSASTVLKFLHALNKGKNGKSEQKEAELPADASGEVH